MARATVAGRRPPASGRPAAGQDEFIERFRGTGPYRSSAGRYGRYRDRGFARRSGRDSGLDHALSASERELYDYVSAHRDGAAT